MPDSRLWLDELTRVAPRTDRTLLSMMARLLADDRVPPDVLLLLVDALTEAAMDAMFDDRLRDAGEAIALAAKVAAAAARPRPGFW